MCWRPGWLCAGGITSVFGVLADARDVTRNTHALVFNLNACLNSASKQPWMRDHCFLPLS